MKQLITTFTSIFFAMVSLAQVPDAMNYQAVARNTTGQALANQSIRVKLSVVKNAVIQYSETRQVVTNALGLFNVQIGSTGAISTTGNFSNINWQSNATPGYVLKVELDINNSGNFIDMGSQALVTVPYAFASKTATETMNIAGRPVDQITTPAIGSRLSWNGSSWTPVKKDTVITVLALANNANYSGTGYQFINAPTEITLDGSQRFTVNFTTGLTNTSTSSGIRVAVVAAFQNISTPGNPIYAMLSGNSYTLLPASSTSMGNTMQFTGVAGGKLPAGTYKVGMAMSILTGGAVLQGNTATEGFIEIKN